MKILFALLYLSFLLFPIRGFTQGHTSNGTDSDSTAYFQERGTFYYEEAHRISFNSKKAKQYYQLSAQYWKKAIELADPISMKLYRNLAMAQYRGQNYRAAEETFQIIEKKKVDYMLQPIIRCFTLGKRNENPSATNSSIISVAEEIVRVFGDNTSELKPQQLQTVLLSMEALALKAFDPVGNNEAKDYDCATAKAHIDKINALNPGYINTRAGLKSVADFCAQ